MLSRLVVKNVALIESAEIEFGAGLNVLSGETGSGKSVLLDSINFVLGAKADKSMIRYGETECSVHAVFVPEEGNAVFSELAEMGIDSDAEIVVFRRFRSDGRGDIKVNGCTVNSAMLRRITSHLVDVHGQSEHFYLLSEANQLKVLDKAAGKALADKKQELSQLLDVRKEIRTKLKALGGDESERGRRLDILRYQMDEIDRAELKEGEEEELAAKKLFNLNLEKIIRSLSEASQYLGAEGGAVDGLQSARRSVAEISSLHPDYSALEDRLESLSIEAEDVCETLKDVCEGLVYDEREAERIEERLDLIRSLKKKYGDSVKKICEYRDSVGEEYDLLSHCDEEFAKLTKVKAENLKKIYSVCSEMTRLRKSAAEKFCSRVEEELRTLNIKNAKFCADFDGYEESDAENAGGDGLDKMRFLFSANAGEPTKPLNKVISGGEMSRLMLAIKTKSSDLNEISTYIFDEIDAGIGGNTARVVAEKFSDIAKSKQIIAVSHLAYICAMADVNFCIEKHDTEDNKTVTNIRALDADAKRTELVRLLGGVGESAAAQSLASEMLDSCAKYKRS